MALFTGAGEVDNGANTGSGGINPIEFPEAYHTYRIGPGIQSPGIIPPNGIRGFKRTTGWDVVKAKGTIGSTTKHTTKPTTEGEIDCLIWLPQHFPEMASFRRYLAYTATRGPTGSAIQIYHPALVDVGVTSVVLEYMTPPYYHGRGKYIVTAKFVEWVPAAALVVSTVTASKTSGNGPDGKPLSGPVQQLQEEIEANTARIAKLSGAERPEPRHTPSRR